MTTEPRQEARELIRAHQDVRVLDSGLPLVRISGRLVDALAAAIEAVNVTEWEPFIHEDGTQRVPVGHYQIAELSRALSAIRGEASGG